MAACAEKNALWGKFLEASGSKLSDAPPARDITVESEGYGYETAMGRACWPSRDPIGETGGVNLYGMVGNDAINIFDVLGQFSQKSYERLMSQYPYLLLGKGNSALDGYSTAEGSYGGRTYNDPIESLAFSVGGLLGWSDKFAEQGDLASAAIYSNAARQQYDNYRKRESDFIDKFQKCHYDCMKEWAESHPVANGLSPQNALNYLGKHKVRGVTAIVGKFAFSTMVEHGIAWAFDVSAASVTSVFWSGALLVGGVAGSEYNAACDECSCQCRKLTDR